MTPEEHRALTTELGRVIGWNMQLRSALERLVTAQTPDQCTEAFQNALNTLDLHQRSMKSYEWRMPSTTHKRK